MRFVPVKSEEQQASGVVFQARDMLVHQRTQCINALRGHMAEYGHVSPAGVMHVGTLIACVDDPESDLPASARLVLQVLIGTLSALQAQIKELEVETNRRAKADPVAKPLMPIPGIGPIAVTAITALVTAAEGFAAGRDFAAWLGLTPLQKLTGGKQKLGAMSKRGERMIRRLLILGASAVIRQACIRGARRRVPRACRARSPRSHPRSGTAIFKIAERGRAAWQKASGYTKRARAESAVSRFKQVIGDGLSSRTDQRRATEVDVTVFTLNRMLDSLSALPNFKRGWGYCTTALVRAQAPSVRQSRNTAFHLDTRFR